MFLTKNHTRYFDKPINRIPQTRTLPDWNDTDSEENEKEIAPPSPINYQYNLLDDENSNEIIMVTKSDTSPKTHYLTEEELQKMKNIEYETKAIEEIVTMDGVRIKPTESTMKDFLNLTNNLSLPVIGSILINKMKQTDEFRIKAKSLFLVQFLAKHDSQFFNFFKVNRIKLTTLSPPKNNTSNYDQILHNVLRILGIKEEKKEQKEEFCFVDPKYDEKRGKYKHKKLISPVESKRMKKQDLLQLNFETKIQKENQSFCEVLEEKEDGEKEEFYELI